MFQLKYLLAKFKVFAANTALGKKVLPFHWRNADLDCLLRQIIG